MPAHLSAHPSLSIPALDAFQLQPTPLNSTPREAKEAHRLAQREREAREASLKALAADRKEYKRRKDECRLKGACLDWCNVGKCHFGSECQVRSIHTCFTHRPVSTFDRVGPFQLTGELVLYGTTLSSSTWTR